VLYDPTTAQSLFNSASNWASIGAQLLNNLPCQWAIRHRPIIASALQVFAHTLRGARQARLQHSRRPIDAADYPVTESVVYEKPFGSLRHFKRAGLGQTRPSC
jgi:poly(3-hydroxybutyrate) depolymerase